MQKNLPSGFKDRPYLLCVSGGADSVALFHVMKDLPLKLSVFHAHHGDGNNKPFRDEAQKFVENLAREQKIEFLSLKASEPLKSENDFRKFRRNFLKSWIQKNPQGIIVMGHHTNDLLETRMMRLIRGTGPDGLIAMRIWSAPVLRPFLESSSGDLKSYLQERGLQWIEDPSNQSSRYLRNWLRNQWLPQLEKRKPGSLKRLSESLKNLSQENQTDAFKTPVPSFSRARYTTLNPSEQIQTLALLLKSQGLQEFTLGQLKEVQRRLDNSQGRLIFKAAGALWTVNAQQILVRPF